MILSDNDIRTKLYCGDIKIIPFNFDQIQPSSVDLTLGDEFIILHPNQGDKNHDGFLDSKLETKYTKINLCNGCFTLPPKQFVLGTTVEKVEIPDNIVGRVEGRSSIGRLGVIVHATAGYVDPGFKGNITLEFYNFNEFPVLLYKDQRVCQIVFEEMASPAKVPYGAPGLKSKYQDQKGVTVSKLAEEFKGGCEIE